MTMTVPSASDSGMFRRGSFTSPAVNVMLFQASAEKSDPVCATQIATNRPNARHRRQARARCRPTPRGVQKSPKLSDDRRGVPAEQQADEDQADERAGLGGREDVLDDASVLEAARVGPGQQRDQQDADELRRRQRQRVAGREVNRRDQVVVVGDPRHEHAEVAREADGRRRRSCRSGSRGTASSRRGSPRAARTLRAGRRTGRRPAASSRPARRTTARRRWSARR